MQFRYLFNHAGGAKVIILLEIQLLFQNHYITLYNIT